MVPEEEGGGDERSVMVRSEEEGAMKQSAVQFFHMSSSGSMSSRSDEQNIGFGGARDEDACPRDCSIVLKTLDEQSDLLLGLSRSEGEEPLMSQTREELSDSTGENAAPQEKTRRKSHQESYVGTLPLALKEALEEEEDEEEASKCESSQKKIRREERPAFKKYRLSASVSSDSGDVALSLEIQDRSSSWKQEKVVPDLAKSVDRSKTVCEQLGLSTSAKDHGHLGGLLAGKIGRNRFVVDYAVDSRSRCRQARCAAPKISSGNLRVGKIPPSIKAGHSRRTHWYHAACIFRSFRNVCKGTRIVESTRDIEDFDNIRAADKETLRAFIAASNTALRRLKKYSKDHKQPAHLSWENNRDVSNEPPPPPPVFFHRRYPLEEPPPDERQELTDEELHRELQASLTALEEPPACPIDAPTIVDTEFDGIVGLALLGQRDLSESTKASSRP